MWPCDATVCHPSSLLQALNDGDRITCEITGTSHDVSKSIDSVKNDCSVEGNTVCSLCSYKQNSPML